MKRRTNDPSLSCLYDSLYNVLQCDFPYETSHKRPLSDSLYDSLYNVLQCGFLYETSHEGKFGRHKKTRIRCVGGNR